MITGVSVWWSEGRVEGPRRCVLELWVGTGHGPSRGRGPDLDPLYETEVTSLATGQRQVFSPPEINRGFLPRAPFWPGTVRRLPRPPPWSPGDDRWLPGTAGARGRCASVTLRSDTTDLLKFGAVEAKPTEVR